MNVRHVRQIVDELDDPARPWREVLWRWYDGLPLVFINDERLADAVAADRREIGVPDARYERIARRLATKHREPA